MSRSVHLYLNDILAAARKALRYTASLTCDELERNDGVYDAVLWNLFVIGEAVNNLPEDLRRRYADIEWRKMIGLRNIIAHAYHRLDPDVLWDVVQHDLPILISDIEKIITETAVGA